MRFERCCAAGWPGACCARPRSPPLRDGQTISALGFGFWRFLLGRRYQTGLWPDLAAGFPHAPTRCTPAFGGAAIIAAGVGSSPADRR